MDKFLRTCKLSKMTEKAIENMNRLTVYKEIESILKNLSTNKVQDKMPLLRNYTKYLKKN